MFQPGQWSMHHKGVVTICITRKHEMKKNIVILETLKSMHYNSKTKDIEAFKETESCVSVGLLHCR